MRFYEHEAKDLLARHGVPLPQRRIALDAAEAAAATSDLGGPVVLKSQVLSGGRMKAGGVRFADTPEEAAEAAEAILGIEINGLQPMGVLVEERGEVEQEYYAAVTWDAAVRRPVVIFSDMGGIDIEEVAEQHPEHLSRTHLSNLRPVSDFEAKLAVSRTGVTGNELNRLSRIVGALVQVFLAYDLTLAEINPIGRLAGGAFVALDSHIDMEEEARGTHARLLAELGIPEEDTRQARPPTEFEIAGAQVDAADTRGVAGRVVEFGGNLGLIIGAGGGSLTLFDAVRGAGGDPGELLRDRRQPLGREGRRADEARDVQARRREDRRDDERRLQHPRRHHGARRDQGRDRGRARPRRGDRDLPHPRLLGGRGRQDPRALRRRVRGPVRLHARGGAARGREGRGRRGTRTASRVHPHRRRQHLHHPGHHRP